MAKRAVIAGNLTDIRNVGVHKAIKLTVEVPAELAQGVLDAFGWPTQVAPVPVALARMVGEERKAPAGFAKANTERSLAQQAGALCKNPVFWAYLTRYEEYCGFVVVDEETCATFVRWHCGVPSRSEIKAGTSAGDLWLDLLEEFHGWEQAEKSGATHE